MENTFIISDDSNWLKPIISELGLIPFTLKYDAQLITENEFDSWIEQNIPDSISCLLIPIELGEEKHTSVQGLRIAMHLRLMQRPIRFIPIILISNREDWQIRQMLRDSHDKDHLDYIIGTNGTDLLKPNVDEIRAVVENIKPLNKENYKLDFYNNIHILPLEDIGKHSLANIWGALRLNEVLNLDAIKDKSLINRTKELYFKYLRAFHTNEENQADSENEEVKLVNCQNKRILLIDDEADKGWKDVLSAIFKDAGNGFQVISDFLDIKKGIEEATKKATEEDWDLILLDLRLNPHEEDKPDSLLKAEDYLGAKLLKVIKDHNAGIQVIMLTASNKAWNMKKLLDLGADGYYIKESPEFNFSPAFTKESYDNFVKEVDDCLNKTYARKLFSINDFIEKRLDKENRVLGNATLRRGTVNLAKVYLKQAFNSIYSYNTEHKEYILYSFLEYYKIVELLGKEMIGEDINKSKIIIKRRIGDIDFIIKSPLQAKIRPIKNNGFIETYETGDYFPDNDDEKYYTGRLSSSLQFSALLLLRFSYNKETVKDFIVLNNLRNTVVAHSANNPNAEITTENIIQLAKLLKKIFDKL